MTGLIAIVGRPNVGKSALFNRIVRKRIAIVHDMPGVTRDRVTAEAEWHGRPFTLVDTGGIGLLRGEKSEDVIISAAFDQVQMAIESAHVIIFVVNVQEGIVPLDAEVAKRLHAAGKPVIVAVNKVDTYRAEGGLTEFSALGFEKLLPVSAIHGEGLDDLIGAAFRHLPKAEPVALPAEPEDNYGKFVKKPTDKEKAVAREAEEAAAPVKIAIVGRPNVGKSSLINKVTGSERVIVSPIPGTTRDAVDVPFEVDTEGVRQKYVLIDTAGVRKARRIDDTVELFSVERTKEAIARCDIAVLVLDAESGILEQDKKVAAIITENRRACIVVVNKWDLVATDVRERREKEIAERRDRTRDRDDRAKRPTMLVEFGAWVQEKLFFLDYAPVIFTSAKDGFQLDRLLEAVRYVAAQGRQKVPTAILNRTPAGRDRPQATGERQGASSEVLLRDPGTAEPADLPAVREQGRAVQHRLREVPDRRTADGLRVRGMSDRDRAQGQAEDDRARPEVPDRDRRTVAADHAAETEGQVVSSGLPRRAMAPAGPGCGPGGPGAPWEACRCRFPWSQAWSKAWSKARTSDRQGHVLRRAACAAGHRQAQAHDARWPSDREQGREQGQASDAGRTPDRQQGKVGREIRRQAQAQAEIQGLRRAAVGGADQRAKAARSFSIRRRFTPRSEWPTREADRTWTTRAGPS